MAVYEVNDIQQTESEEIAEDLEGYGSGFVVTHRSKLKWEWFTQPLTAHLFEFLILSANYKAKQWQGITINRGQCITSINSICEKTGLTARQARTSLKRLESTGEIKVKTTNRFTMVTVCNYLKYQLTGKHSDKQTTNKRQTNDKQTTTTNKGNKGNKRKEVYSDNSDEQSGASWRDAFNQDVIDFVESFQLHIRKEVGSKAPKPTESLFKSASDTVDKLIRLDGHTLDEIKKAMRWAVQDDFWQRNALSLASLRKKTDGLTKFQKILAASGEKPKTQKGYGNNVYQDYQCI